MPSESYSSTNQSSHRADSVPKSVAILRCSGGRWRTERATLAKRQVAAEYRESGARKPRAGFDEQRRVAVRARSVRKNQTFAVRLGWRVQKTANSSFMKRSHSSR